MKEIHDFPGYFIDRAGSVYGPKGEKKQWIRKDGYSSVNLKNTTRLVHRIMAEAFLGASGKYFVDHIDRNRSNNLLENLRICTLSQNQMNAKLREDNSSGFRGVNFDGKTPRLKKRWRAYISVDGKRKVIGRFLTKEDAVMARDILAKKLHGDFAFQNHISDGIHPVKP